MCYFQGMYSKGSKLTKTAVIGRLDASELNFMIDVITERHGIHTGLTAKQGSKDIARDGRTRFGS